MTDNPNLLKKFYNIIDSEKRRAQDANNGQTDVEIRSKTRQKVMRSILHGSTRPIGATLFPIDRVRMKRGVKGFSCKCSGRKRRCRLF